VTADNIYCNSPTLQKRFTTRRRHLYEELMSIRRREHPKKASIISEFVSKCKQVDVFDAFRFEIPKGCRPTSRQKKGKKEAAKK
jgi:hypothetical protein